MQLAHAGQRPGSSPPPAAELSILWLVPIPRAIERQAGVTETVLGEVADGGLEKAALRGTRLGGGLGRTL